MAILVVYVFLSNVYDTEDKRGPLVDFCFTVVVAVFWLSASAAWANGLSGMKSIIGGQWIFADENSVCHETPQVCTIVPGAGFAGANISVVRNFAALYYATSSTLAFPTQVLGFLNFFLWSANLWFLYKETAWFAAGTAQPQQMDNN